MLGLTEMSQQGWLGLALIVLALWMGVVALVLASFAVAMRISGRPEVAS